MKKNKDYVLFKISWNNILKNVSHDFYINVHSIV